jgi:hypothetical protein
MSLFPRHLHLSHSSVIGLFSCWMVYITFNAVQTYLSILCIFHTFKDRKGMSVLPTTPTSPFPNSFGVSNNKWNSWFLNRAGYYDLRWWLEVESFTLSNYKGTQGIWTNTYLVRRIEVERNRLLGIGYTSHIRRDVPGERGRKRGIELR